jgi:hypothetical protein
MKKVLLFLSIAMLLGACKDKTYNLYNSYEPVYTDFETFRNPAKFESSRDLTQRGNIYFKDDYLFMVEPNEGIHFIDNSNPSNPINSGFLKITGCSGLAIKGDYLYVTALIDLVTIDVSSFSNPYEVARMEDVFPTALPIMEKNYPTQTIDKTAGVVTNWKVVKTKEEANPNPVWSGCFNCEFMAFADNTSSVGLNSGGSTGTAGSIAQMTIVNNYLYVIDNNILKPYEISNPLSPVEGDMVYLSWNVETVFPYEDNLFMGTTTGMMIYSTDNPSSPQHIGAISHARACDPVVVQDNYAYVTVRSGGACGGDINQLDVIDVSNLSNPILKKSFELDNPHGLGIDGNTLFVCDGNKGLKVFDATTPETAGDNLIKRFGNIEATDVIPINGVAMVIGEDGIYQYDYSDPEKLELLSTISIK